MFLVSKIEMGPIGSDGQRRTYKRIECFERDGLCLASLWWSEDLPKGLDRGRKSDGPSWLLVPERSMRPIAYDTGCEHLADATTFAYAFLLGALHEEGWEHGGFPSGGDADDIVTPAPWEAA